MGRQAGRSFWLLLAIAATISSGRHCAVRPPYRPEGEFFDDLPDCLVGRARAGCRSRVTPFLDAVADVPQLGDRRFDRQVVPVIARLRAVRPSTPRIPDWAHHMPCSLPRCPVLCKETKTMPPRRSTPRTTWSVSKCPLARMHFWHRISATKTRRLQMLTRTSLHSVTPMRSPSEPRSIHRPPACPTTRLQACGQLDSPAVA